MRHESETRRPCQLTAILIAAAMLLAFTDRALAQTTPPLRTFSTIRPDAIGRQLQSSVVWASPTQNKDGVAIAFRKSFTLAEKPARAAMHLFADVRYVLWVNGSYVDRGPARFQPNGPEYDTVNLARYLQQGNNVLAVLVVGNLSGGKVMRHTPGFTALVQVDGKEIFHSDATWKWTDSTRFRRCAAGWPNLGETLVDARVEDGDWTRADYRDTAWKPAIPIGGENWGPLTARRIPPLRETAVAVALSKGARLPITLRAGEKLEFGTSHIVQAYLVVELDAEANTKLALEPFDVSYIAKAGSQRHFTIDARGISQGAIAVQSGKAIVTGLRLVERLYPFDRVGSFRSSDAFLNKLWTMCARSCEVLSEDSYVDCADRERVEWMDNDPPGFNITRTAMAGPGPHGKPLYADPRLLGEMVRRTALTLQPEGWVKAHTCSDRYDIHAKMEDRACEWVAGMRRYYEATGDVALVREAWPAVVAQMDYFLQRRTPRGLVQARDWVVWGNPVGYLVGEGTTLNVFVEQALRDAGFLAGLIDEKATQARFSQAAGELAAAINRVLWNEKDGAYYSGYFSDADIQENLKEGQKTDLPRKLVSPRTNGLAPSTLHANVFALDRGVVPADRRDRVVAAMLKQLPERPGPDIMVYYYVIKQFYAMDRPELDLRALSLLREGWKGMAASPWECSWESLGGDSKAHIYGMYPGYFLSSYVLGVRWEDGVPLHGKLLIQPHLADLTQAAGVVATEAGPASVSWNRTSSGGLRFQLRIPAGVAAKLSLSAGSAKTFTLNARPAVGKRVGPRYQFSLPPGDYTGTAD
jgi:hypothetical protein